MSQGFDPKQKKQIEEQAKLIWEEQLASQLKS